MEKIEINRESDCLLIVDIQNDFCAGGALGINSGSEIIPVLNGLQLQFSAIVFTRDWHPENHCSFDKCPKFIDKSWPAHCIAGTPGAAFHPDLKVPDSARIVNKGDSADHEAYSAFQNTNLAEDLRKIGIKRIFIGGLATDYCVKASAIDAKTAGFDSYVILDAIRGVDVPEGSVNSALEYLKKNAIHLINSTNLRESMNGS